jgi:hypothetical protein
MQCLAKCRTTNYLSRLCIYLLLGFKGLKKLGVKVKTNKYEVCQPHKCEEIFSNNIGRMKKENIPFISHIALHCIVTVASELKLIYVSPLIHKI